MSIRLETSRRTGIENYQSLDISQFERNWNAEIPKLHPRITARTGMSALYNCHGLTFASRRTRISDTAEVRRILEDDRWEEVELRDVLAGDVVVYFGKEGEANHSGIIVDIDKDLKLPLVCSKWGSGGEYIHQLSDCPSMYGPISKFYRCQL